MQIGYTLGQYSKHKKTKKSKKHTSKNVLQQPASPWLSLHINADAAGTVDLKNSQKPRPISESGGSDGSHRSVFISCILSCAYSLFFLPLGHKNINFQPGVAANFLHLTVHSVHHGHCFRQGSGRGSQRGVAPFAFLEVSHLIDSFECVNAEPVEVCLLQLRRCGRFFFVSALYCRPLFLRLQSSNSKLERNPSLHIGCRSCFLLCGQQVRGCVFIFWLSALNN